MTIAACYQSPEGIVLGADSTASFENHYFNSTQKVFEIGENSTLGLLTWGLGGFGAVSYRTMVAELSDSLLATPAANVNEVAQRWATLAWDKYVNGPLGGFIQTARDLHNKPPHDAADPNNVTNRSADEEAHYLQVVNNYFVGFCIAGYVLPNRTPLAYTVTLAPLDGAPIVDQMSGCQFWGAPNMIVRLVSGMDSNLANDIVNSPHWTGTASDLLDLSKQYALSHGYIPIRDAVDFVHSSIASTIKAMKFSNLAQICGGPIEVAVITTDRRFRWVRHKPWDAAISEGDC